MIEGRGSWWDRFPKFRKVVPARLPPDHDEKPAYHDKHGWMVTAPPAGHGVTMGNCVEELLRLHWPMRFTRIGDLRWAACRAEHIHFLLDFQRLKGATVSARWGVSLTFVPELRGKRLSRKFSLEKAQFDLCIDPIDEDDWAWCSFPEHAPSERMSEVAQNALKAATKDWNRLGTVADVIRCFQERSRRSFVRFSPDNYIQTNIAWGLCLIATGEQTAGEERVNRFCDQFGFSPSTPAIAKAMSEAQRIASNSGLKA